jgi:hypothetical protein
MPAERGYADIGRAGRESPTSGGGGGGRERAMEAARQAAVQQAALDVSAARERQQQEQAAQAVLNVARDLQQSPQRQNVDAITGFAGELGLTPRETEIAMERAMRSARAMQTAQMFSLPAVFGKSLGILEDPRIAARQSMINLATMPNAGFVDGYLTAPIQGGGYVRQGGFLGGTTYTGMPVKGYEGAFANLVNPPVPDRDGRPQQVAPMQDPMTGQARCPAGYVFNETLQACIMDTAATSSFQPTMATAQPMPSGDYYSRMSLLDQPPSGLLEAGFGTPQDFAAANTAFRRGAATRPSMYTDPYNLQGYTLLS